MQIAQDKYCKYANLPHTGGIPENWHPRLETLSGTGDSRPRIHLIGGFLDPRLRILKVGLETRDPGPFSLEKPGTKEL